jgi:hypothetical protein
MKKFLFILLILTTSLSCDKAQRNTKKLEGTWQIYSYAQLTSGGFRTYYDAEGTLSFTKVNDKTLNYVDDFVYFMASDTLVSKRIGLLTLSGKKGLDPDIVLSNPGNMEISNERIYVLTKDDLKIEFYENGIGHVFVLQKD